MTQISEVAEGAVEPYVPDVPDVITEPDWRPGPCGYWDVAGRWRIPATGQARVLKKMLGDAGGAFDKARERLEKARTELDSALEEQRRAIADWEYAKLTVQQAVANQADTA